WERLASSGAVHWSTLTVGQLVTDHAIFRRAEITHTREVKCDCGRTSDERRIRAIGERQQTPRHEHISAFPCTTGNCGSKHIVEQASTRRRCRAGREPA